MMIKDAFISNDMFTLEHASVLQERLGKILQEAYPQEDIETVASKHIDPRWIQEELLEMFTPKALASLFASEMGKGVIIGAFIQKHIFALGDVE